MTISRPQTKPSTWRDQLRPGDIVVFRFPCSDDCATEKARPCLVIGVDARAGTAEIVYGTSRWTDANRGQELHVTARTALAEASLDRPTRFVGTRRTQVELTSPRFVECRGGTAIVGRLGGQFAQDLDRLRRGGPVIVVRRRAHLRRRSRRPPGTASDAWAHGAALTEAAILPSTR